MQHILDFIAALVVAGSAAALAHFGVTLKDSRPCPPARAHLTPVVQRLPAALKGQIHAIPAAERRPVQVRITVTLT